MQLAQTPQPLQLSRSISGSIIFFCYFYTAIMIDPNDVAENIKKSGAYIPGIRPGKRTAEHIDRILTRITLVGALYMSAVCVLPTLLFVRFNVPFYFGGTALLIVVGVGLDTIGQIEARLQSLECEYPEEHIPNADGECEECREAFIGTTPTLYSHTKFRPLFNAAAIKAQSLITLRRYNEAIETLERCRSYDRVTGTGNQLGECYLRLGDLREAEQWYMELLWPSAY